MAGVGSRSSCWSMQRSGKWQSSQPEGARRRKNPSECLLQEEREVNSYAALMGYQLLVVRGLGLLVLTWSTVVLLGGFVPVLGKKDFWCLTVITLMQTAGVFNVGQIKKFSYNIDRLMLGLISSLSAMLVPQEQDTPLFMRWRRYVLAAPVLVAALLFLIVLVPLLPLYTSGLYISTAIAVARLAQRDYGEDADGNLKPALDVLYSLALLQGVLFAAGDVYELADKQLAYSVAQKYGSPNSGGRAVALDYIRDTRSVCDQDPSSSWNGSDRRNVITYAVSLAESSSPGNFAAGVRILDMLVNQQTADAYKDGDSFELLGHRMLMKQLLITAASSSHVIGNLLCALGPRSQYGAEMRVRAARIVAFIATDLHLEQFPQGIHFISSLLQSSPPQDYDDDDDEKLALDTYELDWELDMIDEGERYPPPPPRRGRNDDVEEEEEEDHGYRVLMLHGLRILRKLAVHEHNCRVIRRTRGLLSKVMAPVTCDLLHVIDHGAWSSVVEGSLRTMSRLLVAVPGREIALELSRDIKGAVTAMERILMCDECGHGLQSVATELLTRLYLDMSASTDITSREKFIDMLLDIFFEAKCPIDTAIAYDEGTDGDKEIYKAEAEKRLQRGEIAAGALMRLSFEMEGNAIVTLLKANDCTVDKLCTVLRNNRNSTYGPIAAAVNLETLCTDQHTDDEKCLKSLKNTMIKAMDKVLEEIILCVTKSNNVQAKNETTQVGLSGPELDIENQCGGGAKDRENSRDNSSSSGNLLIAKRQEDEEFMILFVPVALSFCVKVWNTFFYADEDLARRLEEIARRGAALGSFPRTLIQMVERYSRRPTSRNLALLKVISKMVISMMKHRGKYTNEDLDSLIQALSRASSSMLDLDSTVVLASCDDRAWTLENMLKYGIEKPTRSLISLVKEAHELVDRKKAEELSIE